MMDKIGGVAKRRDALHVAVDAMTRTRAWATGVVAILLMLAAAAYAGRVWAGRTMSQRALTPKALAAATPAMAGLPYSRVTMPSGDRTLVAWWVRAPERDGVAAPAVFFLHGNSSTIADHVELQRFLYSQGISSFSFDYSGFGASGGTASLRNAIADAGAAARVFADSAARSPRRVAMGMALGATVLLQSLDEVQPHVHGLIIEGAHASVLEAAVREGKIPGWLSSYVRDVADNVAAAEKVRVPLLAVHSYADERAPFGDAERIMAAVPGQVSLVRHSRAGHSALLTTSRPCDWAQVLRFVREGTLPAARVDSTDACAVRAESIQQAGLNK